MWHNITGFCYNNLLNSNYYTLFNEICGKGKYRNMDIMKIGVNRRKTKYMEIGHHQGMLGNEHIKIGSFSYEKVKTFKYLGS